LAFFAGIWTRWTSVRKVKEGETTIDIFAFLATEPSKEVGAIHPKAMPVILTTREEIDVWMNAPAEDALNSPMKKSRFDQVASSATVMTSAAICASRAATTTTTIASAV